MLTTDISEKIASPSRTFPNELSQQQTQNLSSEVSEKDFTNRDGNGAERTISGQPKPLAIHC